MSLLDAMLQNVVREMDLFKKKAPSQRKQQFESFSAGHLQQLENISLKISEENRHADVSRKRVLDKYQKIVADQQERLEQVATRLQPRQRPEREEEEEALLQQEQQLIFDVDIVHHDSQVQQRQKRLNEVQQNMQQVNELYKEMNLIQQEQNPLFQKIEDSLAVSGTRIEKAKAELVKTKAVQDQQRNNYCLYLFLLTCLLTFIMLDKF